MREHGYSLLSMDAASAAQTARTEFYSRRRSGAPSRGQVTGVTHQLATMLRAGIQLVRALRVVADQTENLRLQRILNQVREDVEEGSSLADAMAKHPKAFSKH